MQSQVYSRAKKVMIHIFNQTNDGLTDKLTSVAIARALGVSQSSVHRTLTWDFPATFYQDELLGWQLTEPTVYPGGRPFDLLTGTDLNSPIQDKLKERANVISTRLVGKEWEEGLAEMPETHKLNMIRTFEYMLRDLKNSFKEEDDFG